ncbi:hypothetical protein HDZ31DRAFT_65453 [Schizophyllum fasciatum]
MTEQMPYAASARVPLIKSPSLRVPQAIQLPPDIHPLPDSVTAYFVYPFTLEAQVIAAESSRRANLAADATRHEQYIQGREEEKQRRRKEALRRVAPGFDPDAVLVPTRTGQTQGTTASGVGDLSASTGHQRSRSVMDDLVDQLAQLDATAGSKADT